MDKRKLTQASFLIIALLLFVVGYFKLATPLLTILFSSFALTQFKVLNRKWISIVIFLICVTVMFYGFIYFIRHAVTELPTLTANSVPKIIEFATQRGFELPFSDIESLKVLAVEAVTDQLKSLARFAQIATEEFVFLIIGLVVSIGLFINPRLDLDNGYAIQNNLYSGMCRELTIRAEHFFRSFSTVIGAQIVISMINTICTAILVYSIGLPYGEIVVVITFLCGLLPIIGNIISNTIICFIAINVSAKLAVICLLFLIGIHKLEYFLNSRIIGGRIRNPMWLTLLALVAGERIMGIPGMILAPVFLNYLKLECSQVEVKGS